MLTEEQADTLINQIRQKQVKKFFKGFYVIISRRLANN